MNAIVSLLAATITTQPTAAVPWWAQILKTPFPLIVIGLFFFLMISNRGGNKDKKAREAMLKQLKRGDRVPTIGGILGTVLRAEETRVEVKVDETNNTKIWFARSAIQRVVEQEKVETK